MPLSISGGLLTAELVEHGIIVTTIKGPVNMKMTFMTRNNNYYGREKGTSVIQTIINLTHSI